MAACVEGEDRVAGRGEYYGVRVGARGNRGDEFEGGTIEDADEACSAIGEIGNIAELAGAVESDATGAGQAFHLTCNFSGLRIDDHNAISAGDIKPVCGGIENQVTPSTCAADVPLVLYMKRVLRWSCSRPKATK